MRCFGALTTPPDLEARVARAPRLRGLAASEHFNKLKPRCSPDRRATRAAARARGSKVCVRACAPPFRPLSLERVCLTRRRAAWSYISTSWGARGAGARSWPPRSSARGARALLWGSCAVRGRILAAFGGSPRLRADSQRREGTCAERDAPSPMMLYSFKRFQSAWPMYSS